MKQILLTRAEENAQAASLLLQAGLYNASANRAYYAVFHAAAAFILAYGMTVEIDHRKVQALFNNEFINRRKVIPAQFKGTLAEMQKIRNNADYEAEGVSKAKATEQLRHANTFLSIIKEKITL
ncbi:MAG: HEPN domain-containing protein [Candidatus Kapabacteria bacterium]|jgi:uncharacterized protein (UPF0332 family)|nr:HEPN domain-containing protein [Candidatus Kapabacteria bacterium]